MDYIRRMEIILNKIGDFNYEEAIAEYKKEAKSNPDHIVRRFCSKILEFHNNSAFKSIPPGLTPEDFHHNEGLKFAQEFIKEIEEDAGREDVDKKLAEFQRYLKKIKTQTEQSP